MLDIDGARIYYELRGEGPPMVLLHGAFGTLRDFDVVMPVLARSRRLVSIDTRGHGRSTLGPESLAYARLEADLARVVDHLELEHFDLMGFSDGGTVALRFASAQPTRVKRLVTIGSDWEPPLPAFRQMAERIDGAFWRARFPRECAAYERLNPEPDLDRLARSLAAMWLDASGYPGAMVDRITCDLLIVRGEQDHLLPRETVDALGRRLPRARVVHLAGAGHAAHRDRPAEFMAALTAFLADR